MAVAAKAKAAVAVMMGVVERGAGGEVVVAGG